jgi:putative CocE/NonD family hydrolase
MSAEGEPEATAPPGLVQDDLAMRCADGTRLAARSWRPRGDGPLPVLLMRQPYGRAIAGTVTYAHPAWYARHGYRVIVQDVRGQGDSEGRFRGFAQEADDMDATLAWVRALPDCNGRVGLYGFSYQGLSQLLTAPGGGTEPPDCLAPAMCGLDERDHWSCEGGAHWWALGLGWALQLAALRCRRMGDARGWWRIRTSLENGAFLREGPSLLERFDPDGMGRRWLRQDPARPEEWVRHRPPERWLRRPMLLVGGWFDPHLRGVLDLHARSLAAGGRPELLIGPWTHLGWDRRAGTADFGPAAAGVVDRRQLAFFDRHLRPAEARTPVELPPGAGAPAAAFDLGLRRWCPLADTDAGERLWPLGADHPGPEQEVLVHDPWRPVPGIGGHLGLDPGPVDRAALDSRPDVLCLAVAPQGQPLTLAGTPELTVEAWADQEGFDLCCALSVVTDSGRVAQQLSTGVQRHLGEGCRRPARRRVRLQPVLATLAPGQQLRVSLALAAWPQVAVNPGSGGIPDGPSGPDHRVITLWVRPAGAVLRLRPLSSATLT